MPRWPQWPAGGHFIHARVHRGRVKRVGAKILARRRRRRTSTRRRAITSSVLARGFSRVIMLIRRGSHDVCVWGRGRRAPPFEATTKTHARPSTRCCDCCCGCGSVCDCCSSYTPAASFAAPCRRAEPSSGAQQMTRRQPLG